ncbi:CDP-diacylglycerol--serine O-phosphatidyltransferase [hydrothermal vent metagenome]|uniref:CDP-diacylglycerol--serine O-phosphatidyltransferase n=1 Tax=hydrothermal vent metagenome TaxID=652676 RepID=A0A1W1BU24_9ZZZZ
MKKIKKGIYLLPNLLTTLGLFAGFYAIILSFNQQFITASAAIFIAMIFDALDGRVARLTNTQSTFGEQYDSMADMVSFGIAPALLVYLLGLNNLGNIGWLAVFVYVAGGALRLARFNSQIDIQDKKYFQGLPSPAAAALVSSMVWTFEIYHLKDSIYLLVIIVVSGVLMVSNIRYYSFKDINLKGRVPFKWILLVVVFLVTIAYKPAQTLFIGFLIYVISGVVWTIVEIKRKKSLKNKT